MHLVAKTKSAYTLYSCLIKNLRISPRWCCKAPPDFQYVQRRIFIALRRKFPVVSPKFELDSIRALPYLFYRTTRELTSMNQIVRPLTATTGNGVETASRENRLILIVPCYNEEDNIRIFVQTVEEKLSCYDWNILFVNDGSIDDTWPIIVGEHQKNPRVLGLCFSRNFGHQNALKAGLEFAAGLPAHAYVTLDVDLQHPISLIPQMVDALKPGVCIVQAQRDDTGRRISFFKKFTSAAFYAFFSFLSGIPMSSGMSDFRLINRKTLEFVLQCNERDLFLRGLLPWSGLKTIILPYIPEERRFGTSKFTLKKMMELALSGVVGYSTKPLYMVMGVGFFSLLFSMMYFVYVLTVYFCGYPVSVGWASLIACVLAIGGVNMLMLGVVGVYLGKLFMEEKDRPTYVVAEHIQ